jgi:hypothetical protein
MELRRARQRLRDLTPANDTPQRELWERKCPADRLFISNDPVGAIEQAQVNR